MRQRSTPVNPRTQRQSTMRSIIALLSAAWSETLTALQRELWEVYADNIVVTNRLGSQVKLTGFNQFVRSNSFALQNSLARVDDGPIILTLPGSDPTMVGVIDETNQEISVVFDDSLPWVDMSGAGMGVYMSHPQSAGTTFIGGPWRLAGTILGDDTTAPTTPETMAVPFPVGEGQVVAVRARIFEEDGRLSNHFLSQSFVAA